GRRREDFYGLGRLAAALREEAAPADRPLPEIEQAIVGRALDWAGGQQHDDICLLMARRRAFVAPDRPAEAGEEGLRTRPAAPPTAPIPAPPGGWHRRSDDPL